MVIPATGRLQVAAICPACIRSPTSCTCPASATTSQAMQAACPAVPTQGESTSSTSASISCVSSVATPVEDGGGEESSAARPERSDAEGDSSMFDAPPMHDPLVAESPTPMPAPLPPMLVFDNAAYYGHHVATPVGSRVCAYVGGWVGGLRGGGACKQQMLAVLAASAGQLLDTWRGRHACN